MTTNEEYQSYARECIRWARAAKTEDERKAFLDLASAWATAAAKIAANGQAIPSTMMQPRANTDPA
jgi:hypothetical protein